MGCSPAKNLKRVSPQPIIDNLAVIGDHRHCEAQAHSVDHFFGGKALDGAGNDYVSALRFLVSYNGRKASS